MQGETSKLVKTINTMLADRGIPKMRFYREIGISAASFSAWKDGSAAPSFSMLVKLAEYFSVPLSVLFGNGEETKNAPSMEPEAAEIWKEYTALDDTGRRVVRAVMRELGKKEPATEPKKTKVIPLFGASFAAGRGEPDFGNPWEDYTVPESTRADFAVRISGNSMEPYLHDGTIVLGKRGNPVDGDVAVLLVDGAFLVKQVCEDSFGNLYLFALNRERSDADDTIMHDSGRTVRCFGTVIMDKRVSLPGRGKA